jgi:hypothetical protein
MTTYIVSFTGGLGAQLYSAAAYYYLEQQGESVIADMNYFNITPRIATTHGQVSIWKYELEDYNIPINKFKQDIIYEGWVERIDDGVKKGLLGEAGFKSEEIRQKFPINFNSQLFIKEYLNNEEFICLHVRRGDYLNVASYIIPDAKYFDIIKEVSKNIKTIVVVSDTPISQSLKDALDSLNLNIIYQIGGNIHIIHGIMRLSTILICSNSQFSMTAGFLRDNNLLTYLPKQYTGDINSDIDKHLLELEYFKFY